MDTRLGSLLAIFGLASGLIASLASGTPYPTTLSNFGSQMCTSFHYVSWGDPHIVTFGDGRVRTVDHHEDLPNFVTVENSLGGSTTISTSVKTYDLNAHVTLNKQIVVQHGDWTLTANLSGENANALIVPVVTDAEGTHVLSDGDTFRLADQANVTFRNGTLSVGQALASGGSTFTTITASTAGDQSGLNVGIEGKGKAYVNGTAAQQATDSAQSELEACGILDGAQEIHDAQFPLLDGMAQQAVNGASGPPYASSYTFEDGVTGNASL